MVVGTVPWLWMILTPSSAAGEVHLIPIVDLVQVLTGDALTAFYQVGGNLLVFAAFGFFAPVRWRLGAGVVTLIAAGGSIVVELLQYTLALGRVTSVDDVLLNASGAGLAALLSRRLLVVPAAPVPAST
jgi:glycopeptide antibiotics resistance protein